MSAQRLASFESHVCLFPTSSNNSHKATHNPERLSVTLPPPEYLASFLADHHLELKSLVLLTWARILQVYSNAEVSVFGLSHETTTTVQVQPTPLLSTYALHLQHSANSIELLQHINHQLDLNHANSTNDHTSDDASSGDFSGDDHSSVTSLTHTPLTNASTIDVQKSALYSHSLNTDALSMRLFKQKRRTQNKHLSSGQLKSDMGSVEDLRNTNTPSPDFDDQNTLDQSVDSIGSSHASKYLWLSHLSTGTFNSAVIQRMKDSTNYSELNANSDALAQDQIELTLLIEAEGNENSVSLVFSSSVQREDAMHAASAFTRLMTNILNSPYAKFTSLDLCSPYNIRVLQQYNKQILATPSLPIQDLISKRAQIQGARLAVSSWDGNLSYDELESLSSHLAAHLISLHVRSGIFVPLLFQKSKWAVVAVLGVIKAGGAYVLIDPSYPQERIRTICEDLDANIIVCGAQLSESAQAFTEHTVVLHKDSPLWQQERSSIPTSTDPHSPLYAVFTSGSTGRPKGVVIEHGAFYSRAVANIPALGLSPDSNVLQFASYAFQISNRDILFTLIAGGRVCIPSESQRLSNLTTFINHHNVTWACLTSAVVDLLRPDRVPTLKTLVMGGEPMSLKTVKLWSDEVLLINAYGSSECAGVAALNSEVSERVGAGNIGRGVGSVIWIVDMQDHNQLLPVGAVGEMMIESPALARGYLKDDNKTEASFGQTPSWLPRFRGDTSQSQRLYLTGDLACMNPDGTFTYLGRKTDNLQVKVHGQRVELTEIEYHIQEFLDTAVNGTVVAVVDVVVPRDREQSVLVAFLSPAKNVNQMSITKEDFMGYAIDVSHRLQDVLPSHMLPAAYVTLEHVPTTLGGKKDRRQLREFGASLTWEQMMELNPNKGPYLEPRTSTEFQLQQLLGAVLNIPAQSIGISDNFFRLGGDSVVAMRLVSEARESGLHLNVVDVFRNPRIDKLAQQVSVISSAEDYSIAPFSLLKPGVDTEIAKSKAAILCGIEASEIVDIYPCTPLQEALLASTVKRSGDYTETRILRLRDGIDVSRLSEALSKFVEMTPMMRTRIVDVPDQGLVQVVVDETFVWHTHNDLNAYLLQDTKHPMGLGLPLTRFAFIEQERESQYLVWTIHHALYDGWSKVLMDRLISNIYNDQKAHPLAPLNRFIKHLLSTEKSTMETFWRQQFAGSEAVVFPTLPSPTHQPQGNAMHILDVENIDWSKTNVTPASSIRAAWSILQARHVGTNDIVFGATVIGRQASVLEVERMAGPLIATVPIRITLDPEASISTLLQEVQAQAVEMIPFEQIGLQRIQQLGEELQQACHFQTLIVVQPQEETSQKSESLFQNPQDTASDNQLSDVDPFATYSITLVCRLTGTNKMSLRFSYDSVVIERAQIERVAHQFEHVLKQLCIDATLPRKVKDVTVLSKHDLYEIWQWNSSNWETQDTCVHEIIQSRVRLQPENLAVDAWDGALTYSQLDMLSTRLAHQLIENGVRPGAFVPLCFEKSMWMPVAQLGAMKAGGTSVAMDSTVPEERLRVTIQQALPKIIVSSVANKELADRLVPGAVLVSGPCLWETSTSQDRIEWPRLPVISSSQPLLTLFTSGSSGVPKGAVITHSAFTTAIKYHGPAFGISKGERIYDFASYNFDISWFNALQSFAWGACLCIPSESDRRSDLQGSIIRTQSTVLFLTPSVARLLDPKMCPRVRTIALGGEPQKWSDFKDWPESVRRLTVYGPAECTVVSNVADASVLEKKDKVIGPGLANTTWLVDSDDPSQLVPIGCVGELWLEGPLVGSGYLNNPERTAAAFVKDPPWLLRGTTTQPGRSAALYRTGDLMRYNTDGTLLFAGRRDFQVKLRGQRVELSEVEFHVQRGLFNGSNGAVTAEVIIPNGSSNQMLVAFVPLEQFAQECGDDARQILLARQGDLQEKLSSQLPAYMIPSVYIPMDEMPMTATGKTDRRRLREIGSSMKPEELNLLRPASKHRTPPSTSMERKLQNLWASILEIQADTIYSEDSFLRVGGDSITAMRLVGLAREHGMSFSAADVFRQPRLADLAKVVKLEENADIAVPDPYSLLKHIVSTDVARDQAAALCGVTVDQILDIFPCTPLQQGFIAMTAKREGGYVARFVYETDKAIDLERLKNTWQKVAASAPILRTRIISLKDEGLVQVVVDELPSWTVSTDSLFEFMHNDQEHHMGLGTSLARLAVVDTPEQRKCFLVLTIHHALYDGWSLPLLLKDLQRTYLEAECPARNPFQLFVSHVNDVDMEASAKFWKSELSGCEAEVFPKLPSTSYQPHADQMVRYRAKRLKWSSGDITASTMVRAAWAQLLAKYTDSKDVLFGATVTGRQASLSGIENVLGPTIATVPLRINIDPNSTVHDLLKSVQTQALEMTAFEQIGLQQIRRIDPELEQLLQFQSLLVIQPPAPKDSFGSNKLVFWPAESEDRPSSNLGIFNSYALMILCQLEEAGIEFQISFDSQIISPAQVQRIAQQLEHVLRQLIGSDETVTIADIGGPSPQDLADIWRWNGNVPDTPEICVHDMFTKFAAESPGKLAIDSWDGTMTYSSLNDHAIMVAQILLHNGVTSGQIVPLCFEKSIWLPVALFGVLYAGATPLMISKSVPKSRIHQMIDVSKATLALSSETQRPKLPDHVKTLLIDSSLTHGASNYPRSQLPINMPDDSAVIFFTSGSTGTPKGIVQSHRALTASVDGYVRAFGMSSSRRLFQFTSYDFDVASIEIHACFSVGACLCIPSEEQRVNDLPSTITKLKADCSFINPSTLKTLSPSQLLTLRTIIVAGEPLSSDLAHQWSKHVSLYNWYGPAEGSNTSHILVNPEKPWSGSIGRSLVGVTWVVVPSNIQQLAPIGTVGELLIEGRILADGYLNSPEKTSAVFLDSPSWLLAGGPHQPGRQTKLYRTGDLVFYNDDGTLTYIGRSDNQVKIRGQRVELGEIAHHVRQALNRAHTRYVSEPIEIVAEVLPIPGESKMTAVVAFICLDKGAKITFDEHKNSLRQLIPELESLLSESLPVYMVPSVFVPVPDVPLTATGKVNRRLLRDSMSEQQWKSLLNKSQEEYRQPENAGEELLQKLWMSVLKRDDGQKISRDANFFRIGGDSIVAMRMVALARGQKMALSVAEVFRHPRLCDLAKSIGAVSTSARVEYDPFTLLEPGIVRRDAQRAAALQCNIDTCQVIDMYPCTPLQEGLIALTSRRPGDYIAKRVLILQDDTDLVRLKESVKVLCDTGASILRTRIINLSDYGLFQIIVDEDLSWEYGTDLEEYLAKDAKQPMGLGSALARFAVIDERPQAGRLYFVWTLHHALYDGWSSNLMENALEAAYEHEGHHASSLVPFSSFVAHICKTKDMDIEAHWNKYFAGSEAASFPPLPSKDYFPSADSTFEHCISDIVWRGGQSTTTASTAMQTAWAILQTLHCDTSDVVFGTTVMGRQADLADIDKVCGPTIATVPVRIVVNSDITIRALLEQVQTDTINNLPYEHAGLQRIQQISLEAAQACQFQTLLIVQPPEAEGKKNSSLYAGSVDMSKNVKAFTTYSLMVLCQLKADGMILRFSFDSKVIQPFRVEHMASQLEHLLRQMIGKTADTSKRISELETVSNSDIKRIEIWNDSLPEAENSCLDDIFSRTVERSPEAPAVEAWDGKLTYRELDEVSTKLAYHLIAAYGIKGGDIVPLCFEKSKWTPISALAIMKAGAASVLLDTELPAERLLLIAEHVQAKLILTHVEAEALAQQLADNRCLMNVPEWVRNTPSTVSPRSLPEIKPSATLYIVFTSGSTGIPKGVVVSHRNFSSAIRYQQEAMNLNSTSRIYDFSSHAFDAVWSNMLHAITSGGCLCIPSQSDRKNDLAGSMNSLRVTFADLTPSVGRLLDPSSVPSLSTLVLAGEAMTQKDVDIWASHVNLINVYGPAECTPSATYNSIPPGAKFGGEIGRGQGLLTWVVSKNGQSLAPLFTVGELWLEGPLVGNGYLNNPEKTKAAFVDNPPWLPRKGRLYRTGDLVKYKADGSLIFVGRGDEQIKISGQRVELGEIEYHVRQALHKIQDDSTTNVPVDIVTEVIKPKDGSKPVLVVFSAFGGDLLIDQTAKENSCRQLATEVRKRLSKVIPSYMIPSVFLPVGSVPLTPSGKIDRRSLRQEGAHITRAQLSNSKMSQRLYRAPTTATEKELQRLWARILRVDVSTISLNDDFFSSGGDSILAMRLVAAARENNLYFAVADVFDHPVLADLSKVANTEMDADEQLKKIAAFSLLRGAINEPELRGQLAGSCGVAEHTIEDAYPCTPLQEGLIALSTRRAGDYTARRVLELQPDIKTKDFTNVLLSVIASTPILRTRIVDLPGQGLVQVVLSDAIKCAVVESDVETFILNDKVEAMGLGKPLTRFGLTKDPTTGKSHFVWTIHHALYDGFSMNIIDKLMDSTYQGLEAPNATTKFSNFVEHAVTDQDPKAAIDFWQTMFEGCQATSFPSLPSSLYHPRADRQIYHKIENLTSKALMSKTSTTASTAVRVAWGIVQAYLTKSQDVVYGMVSSGRQAALTGIDRVVGPTITTIPVRLALNDRETIGNILQRTQKEASMVIKFEQHGIQRIKKVSKDANNACQFQTLLVIQPKQDTQNQTTSPLFLKQSKTQNQTGMNALDDFTTYALTLICQLEEGAVQLKASFDSTVIEEVYAKSLVREFEHVLQQMFSWTPSTKITELSMTNGQHLISSLGEIRPDSVALGRNIAYETTEVAQETKTLSPSNHVGPDSDMEKSLTEVLMDVLNLDAEEISMTASFVQLGGDSISAMQVTSRCRSKAIAVTVGELLRDQTIRELAKSCSSIMALKQNRFIDLGNDDELEGVWPLSPIQRMFFDAHPNGLNHYNQSYLLKLTSNFSGSIVRAALQAIVSRHTMLRARYQRNDIGDWKQLVSKNNDRAFGFAEHKIKDRDSIRPLVQSTQESLNIIEGPVFAGLLLGLPQGEQYLFLVSHHLVIDLVSWRVLWHDLEQILKFGQELPPQPLSFQRWGKIQFGHSQKLTPTEVLPYKVDKPQMAYWGVPLAENIFGKSESFSTVLDQDATRLVLSQSNDCLKTEPTDILIGTLLRSFRQVFTDRTAPAVLIESHGREAPDPTAVDLSETIGWFTTLYPLQIPGNAATDAIDSIKFTKDMRRKVPGKGRPYFASRYLDDRGREKFGEHDQAELLFNYSGVFQQLESRDSLFRSAKSEGLEGLSSDNSPRARRTALIEVEAGVVADRMHISFFYHAQMKHQDRLRSWSDAFLQNLKQVARDLTHGDPIWTLSEFPSISLSYSSLDALQKEIIEGLAMKREDIRDIYPCTPMQEGIILSKKRGAATYSNSLYWEFKSTNATEISPEKIATAWKSVVKHHAVLSTVFVESAGADNFAQVLIKDFVPTIEYIDIGTLTPQKFALLPHEPVFHPGQPEHTFSICQGSNNTVVCRLNISHALFDAESVSVLTKDLIMAYQQQALDPAPAFKTFVQELEITDKASRLSYWTTYLQDAQPCIAPTDKLMEQNGSYSSEEGILEVTRDITSEIAAFCRDASMTRSAFLQVAWALTLSWFTQMRDVSFGYLASGRDVPIQGIENMMGPLINLLVSRIDLSARVRDVLKSSSAQSIKSLEYQHVSLAEIQHELGLKEQRLFNTAMTVRNMNETSAQSTGEVIMKELEGSDPQEFDMVLGGGLKGQKTLVTVSYRKSAISEELAGDVCKVLTAALRHLMMSKALQEENNQPLYDAFFERLTGVNEKQALEFWHKHFDGSESTVFPILPSSTYRPEANAMFMHEIIGLNIGDGEVGMVSEASLAWAVLISQHSNTNDVVFGLRQSIDLTAHQSQEYCPMRICTRWNEDINTVLQNLRQTISNISAYSKIGSYKIRQSSQIARQACQYQSRIDIRSTSEDYNSHGFESKDCAITLCVQPSKQGVRLQVVFDDSILGEHQVSNLLVQFENILRRLSPEGLRSEKLKSLRSPSQTEVDKIWAWNETVPKTANKCVHEVIADRAQQQPEAQAIDAWDGKLSYKQLEDISTVFAYELIKQGVKSDVIVPLCFEKSLWTPVAMLAVSKAGGTILAMDVTQPKERLRQMTQQVNPVIVVSSAKSQSLASSLSEVSVVVLDSSYLTRVLSVHPQKLPLVEPSTNLYVMFTSGSTGVPKGAVMTHVNLSSAIYHQATASTIDRTSRVFDFASYAFDVAITNTLLTFAVGGCICTPEATEAKSDIVGSINNFRATHVEITPTLARTLDPHELPNVQTFAFSGESIMEAGIDRWPQSTRILNIYGPAECSGVTSIAHVNLEHPTKASIGKGLGLNTWIVDPENDDQLAGISMAGELWLEGPLVGAGYLNNQEKTLAAFVKDPSWLLRGGSQVSGRGGVLYRTGDLVKYNDVGELMFIGRKDEQRKIRGQRIELGDVEAHLQRQLSDHTDKINLAAEIITPKDGLTAMLIAFIAPPPSETQTEDELSSKVDRLTAGLNEKLSGVVPSYMIPSAYMALKQIPTTGTGKTDRKQLRNIGSSRTLEQYASMDSSREKRQPITTIMEKQLQSLWAIVLKIELKNIGSTDNFFKIGGDSIGAMKLVATARSKGFSITIADVFEHPKLCDLAKVLQASSAETYQTSAPLGLLGIKDTDSFLRDEIKPQLSIGDSSISDVLPLAPYQASAVTAALQSPPGQLYHFYVDFLVGTKASKVQSCCKSIVEQFDILRTVFVRARGSLWQVVLDTFAVPLDTHVTEMNIEDYTQQLCQEDTKPQKLGQSFLKFFIVQHGAETRLIGRISHAYYDGMSLSQIFEALGAAFQGQTYPCQPSNAAFMSFTRSQEQKAWKHWRSLLKGSTTTNLPVRSTCDEASDDALVVRGYAEAPATSPGITAATMFTAACADTLAKLTKSTDVVFGRLVSGRAGHPAMLQDSVGCYISNTPVRVQMSSDRDMQDIMESVQTQYTQTLPFESVDPASVVREVSNNSQIHHTDPLVDVEDTVFGLVSQFQNIEERVTTNSPDTDELELHFCDAPRRAPHNKTVRVAATPRSDGSGLEIDVSASPKYYDMSTLEDVLRELQASMAKASVSRD